jgi:hypothetical protein
MGFQMSYNKEELQGAPPVPAGWYTLQFKGFKPVAAKIKQGETESGSINLNPELVIIGNPDYENRRIFSNLNSKAGFIIFDFVHACGLPMEEVQDEFAGTEKANYTLPGIFEGSDQYPTDPSKWKYLGPLTNKTLEVEVAEIPAQTGTDGKFYKAKNDIRQFKCAVPGCQEKHSTNLIKG